MALDMRFELRQHDFAVAVIHRHRVFWRVLPCQNCSGQWVFDQLADRTFERASAIRRVEALFRHLGQRRVGHVQNHFLIGQTRSQTFQLDLRDETL